MYYYAIDTVMIKDTDLVCLWIAVPLTRSHRFSEEQRYSTETSMENICSQPRHEG